MHANEIFLLLLTSFSEEKNSHRKGKQTIFLDAKKHLTKEKFLLTFTFIHSLTHSGSIIKHLPSARLVPCTVDVVVNKKDRV